MVSIIPSGKDISVVHINPDWGYIAYIEKRKDERGRPIYRVGNIPLEGNYRLRRRRNGS